MVKYIYIVFAINFMTKFMENNYEEQHISYPMGTQMQATYSVQYHYITENVQIGNVRASLTTDGHLNSIDSGLNMHVHILKMGQSVSDIWCDVTQPNNIFGSVYSNTRQDPESIYRILAICCKPELPQELATKNHWFE